MDNKPIIVFDESIKSKVISSLGFKKDKESNLIDNNGKLAISQLFEQREEQINKEVEKLCEKTKQIAKTEMNLFKFELLCASSISEKKLKSIVKSVRELRNRAWKEALKQTKGNEDKAWAIYGKIVEKID